MDNWVLWLCIPAAVIVAVVIYRRIIVAKGTRWRDSVVYEKVSHIETALTSEQPVDETDIRYLLRHPELRIILYPMLSHFQKLSLFPAEYLSEAAQAESELAYFLYHPSALGSSPVKMDLMKVIEKVHEEITGRYYVFQYRAEIGNWAYERGWMLGMAGPYFSGQLPYVGTPGTFTKFDEIDETSPDALVDFIHSILKKSRRTRFALLSTQQQCKAATKK